MTDPVTRRTGAWVVAAILALGVGAGVLSVWWHKRRAPTSNPPGADMPAGIRRDQALEMLGRMKAGIERVLRDPRKDVGPTGPPLGWIDPQTGKRIDDGMAADPYGVPWVYHSIDSLTFEVMSQGANVRLTVHVEEQGNGIVCTIRDIEGKR